MHTSKMISSYHFWRLVILFAGISLLQACATTDLHSVPDVRSFDALVSDTNTHAGQSEAGLRVMTLNLAHGRGESFHQLLQTTATTRVNLDRVSALLRREQPHVVALQEADGPSFWSGNFHHVDYLAERAVFGYAVNGMHVNGLGLAYGTALLSALDLDQPGAVTFNPELDMTPKGFVVSRITWPGQPHVEIDIVSLHLAFSSASLRYQQAQELIDYLRERDTPVVVMGDFNDDWEQGRSVVGYIADQLGLHAYQPTADGQKTFPYNGKRLDWILISNGLEFKQHRVLTDAVSDHRGVIAELGLNTQWVTNSYQ